MGDFWEISRKFGGKFGLSLGARSGYQSRHAPAVLQDAEREADLVRGERA